jgi:hypothetical protein
MRRYSTKKLKNHMSKIKQQQTKKPRKRRKIGLNIFYYPPSPSKKKNFTQIFHNEKKDEQYYKHF